MDSQKLFSQCFIKSFQESVSPRSDLFLGHTKNFSIKFIPKVVIRDACETARNSEIRVDEEFLPVKSGVCGYYVTGSLESSYYLIRTIA